MQSEKETLEQAYKKMSREVARLMSVDADLRNREIELEKYKVELPKAEEELRNRETELEKYKVELRKAEEELQTKEFMVSSHC